jgi:hypothetical protein
LSSAELPAAEWSETDRRLVYGWLAEDLTSLRIAAIERGCD